MIRTILLLLPIYVTLFWSIALAGNEKKHSTPRRFLGKFMLFPLVIFISHFIYFSAEKEIYPYFDVVLQFASLMVFPFYYIYFRLLTVDEKFSLKTHIRFLIIPTIITAFYSIGVFLTPKVEFGTWLFNQNAFPDSGYIQFLNVMRMIIRITYLIQVIVSVTGNYLLIRKYGAKAEQFYSDLEDGKYNNARLLNLSIIIMSIASFCFTAIGREFLMSQDTMIYSGWSVFSIMLFIIGYMGIKQKPINPTFELETASNDESWLEEIPLATQKKILDKILAQFDEKKIYLNSQLTIMDVAQLVGTNRSYISGLINRQYNQNFCSFVNNYRLEELKEIIHNSPDSTNDILAENSGFGSVISLKRAIQATAGISITEWKYNELINEKDRVEQE
jgi:AraC-like DNA-binding protein